MTSLAGPRGFQSIVAVRANEGSPASTTFVHRRQLFLCTLRAQAVAVVAGQAVGNAKRFPRSGPGDGGAGEGVRFPQVRLVEAPW